MKKLKLYRIEIWSHDKAGDNANMARFNLLASDAKEALAKAEKSGRLGPGEYVSDVVVIETVDYNG